MRAFAVGLTLGSLALLRQTASPEAVFAAIPSVGVALLVALAVVLVRRARGAPGGAAGPFVIGVLAGVLWTSLACRSAAERVLDERLVGVDVVVEGRVVGVPVRDGARLAFELDVERRVVGGDYGGGEGAGSGAPGNGAESEANGTPVPVDVVPFAPRRLRLSRYGRGPAVRAGERWRLSVRLRPLATLRNAGGFDRVRHLLGRGVDASGGVRRAPAARRLSTGHGIDAWRERLADGLTTIAERADGDTDASGRRATEAAALVQALVLGLPERVPDATRELLRDTGTAHLLAISGLHVTLVAGWGLWLGRALARRAGAGGDRAATWGLVAGLALAAAYALLAGAGLPVRRALAMLAVCAVAAARCRVLVPASALAVALVAALAVDPLAPLSVGFWLSFGTVGALVWLHAGRLRPTRAGLAGRVAAFAALSRTHLLLGIALLPVTAWFFRSGASIAPLANLVAVPVVALVVVPLAFLALALSLVAPAAAAVALVLLHAVSDRTLGLLGALLASSGGAWTLTPPSLEALVLALAAFAVLFAPRGIAPRPLALVLLLPVLLANARAPRVEGFELHVLDVGQGLAALVLTPHETWLYDTGGRLAPGFSMLEAVVVPYLHAIGRRRIDTIVVSHPDSDHSAGLDDALVRWPDARVIVGVPDGANMPADAEPCRAGTSERHDGVGFSFLHPAAHDAGEDNDLSCVLLVHLGASRALLTGDIERAGEARLAARVGTLTVDVMTAPHHGSRTSSGKALLDAVSAARVVFPAGYRNAHRFPHADVRMRYNERGTVSHLTARDGALRFAFGIDGPLAPPSTWHGTRLRFWHDMVEPSCAPSRAAPGQRAQGPPPAPIPGQSSCGKS